MQAEKVPANNGACERVLSEVCSQSPRDPYGFGERPMTRRRTLTGPPTAPTATGRLALAIQAERGDAARNDGENGTFAPPVDAPSLRAGLMRFAAQRLADSVRIDRAMSPPLGRHDQSIRLYRSRRRSISLRSCSAYSFTPSPANRYLLPALLSISTCRRTFS